jgi:DnaK suppressor protein
MLSCMITPGDMYLSDFRKKLVTRAAELRDRVNRVRADLGRQREPLPKDSSDAAIVLENDEILGAIDDTARRELAHIEHALLRFDEGMFGLCETCGAPIEQRRLEAVPYTTRCSGCAQEF